MSPGLEWFPIWNNIAFLSLVGSYIYIARKRVDIRWYHLSWQICFAVIMCMSSTVFHLCNIEDECLHGIPSDGWLVGDVASALNMIASAVSIYVPEPESFVFLPAMFLINYVASINFIDYLPILAVIFGLNLTILLYLRISYWIEFPRKHLKTFAAFICFGVALTFKELEQNPTDEMTIYCWFHGLWHIFICIACNLLVLDSITLAN